MKRISTCLLCAMALASSCKSFKNTTASGKSHVPGSSKENTVFLDGVSVTPGEQRAYTLHKQNASPYVPGKTATNFDIEAASFLQIKYATMLNVPVEALTNLALLKDIDYWWGTRYCMGGATENCIDCSAFTQNIIRDVYAVQLPRTAEQQYNNVAQINYEDLREGDLVFFQTIGRNISHVGVYLTNNKFVHAATSGGVMISDLNEEYWKKRYRAAGRVVY